jgi:integrase
MLRDQVAQRDRGVPLLPDPRRLLVDTLFDNLLAEYRANGRRSVDRADLSCRHLLRYFKGRSAVSVTGADIPRYADLRLREKASPATINRELAAVRRAFRLAVLQGLLLMAPPVPGLRENNVRTGFFEPEQFEAVCRRLKDIEADLVRFCYHSGWRTKSEVFPLTWAQVDWTGGLVRLEPGTTRSRSPRSCACSSSGVRSTHGAVSACKRGSFRRCFIGRAHQSGA